MTDRRTRIPFLAAMDLIDRAAALYEMNPWQLVRRGRERKRFQPRFAVIWVLRQIGSGYPLQTNPYSYHRLAGLLGFDDHTSVRHAYLRATAMREQDPNFRTLTDDLLAYAHSLGAQVEVIDEAA